MKIIMSVTLSYSHTVETLYNGNQWDQCYCSLKRGVRFYGGVIFFYTECTRSFKARLVKKITTLRKKETFLARYTAV